MTSDDFANLEEFQKYREKLNQTIMERGSTITKRFFNLDTKAYDQGALDTKTKEMLGLVASAVLRCNDCITYHTIRCVQEGLTEEEFFEVMNVALVVGGSIVIPHFRRALERFYDCQTLSGEETQES